MQGWYKLHRKITESPIFCDADMLRLWILCLSKATHKEKTILIEKQEVNLLPGQFITGRYSLYDDYNRGVAPRKKIKDTTLWNWLKKLELLGNIDIKTTNKYSVVTVIKWDEYQSNDTTLTTEPQQIDNRLTTEPQQIDTNKNVKNIENVKNEKESINTLSSKPDIPYSEIINYLNDKAGTSYRSSTKSTQNKIKARWNENFTLSDFMNVIDKMSDEWKGSNMEQYLRPETLFGNKFESYLNKKEKVASSSTTDWMQDW